MKIAVVGKGGAGKTVISGTLARLLARQGNRVLAVDLDTNPGLALSLGLGLGVDASLPAEAVEESKDAMYGYRLRRDLTPAEVVERYSIPAPDGVRYLAMGKIERAKHLVQRTVVATQDLMSGFNEPGWHVLGDLEAGPTTPFEGYTKFAEFALLVARPGASSSHTARRLAAVLRNQNLPFQVLGNQVRDTAGTQAIEALAASLGAPLIGCMPWDPAVAECERLGLAPLDEVPGSPVVAFLDRIGHMLPAMAGATR